MATDLSEAFEHDVAVSFLSSDLPYALALKDAIGPSLAVFVYTGNQDELAATMGVGVSHLRIPGQCADQRCAVPRRLGRHALDWR